MESASGLLGPAIMVMLAVIGGLAGYFTLRANFGSFRTETERRFGESEADRKELRTKLETVDREAVRRGDLDRVEDRIGKRLDQVSHDLKGAITQIIPTLAGLRSRTPREPEV